MKIHIAENLAKTLYWCKISVAGAEEEVIETIDEPQSTTEAEPVGRKNSFNHKSRISHLNCKQRQPLRGIVIIHSWTTYYIL